MHAPCWHSLKTVTTESTSLQLTAQELATVQGILRQHLPGRTVQVFGSRAKGLAKPYSDLDLAIMGNTPIAMNVLGQLNEAFASSDLPWRVDVLDWASTSDAFRQHINNHSLPLLF